MTDARLSLGEVALLLRDRGLLLETRGSLDTVVTSISQDSRTLGSGALFVAWDGVRFDAHAFVGDTIGRGARAAIVERFVEADLPQLLVTDARCAAGIVAHGMAGDPSAHLRIAAVTGTNGKTTTALLIRHLLGVEGPAAALGTLGLVGPDGEPREGTEGLTTPGPVDLASILRSLVQEGVRSLAMEASSHALDQRRLDGMQVDVGVFTNLTRDHLDYHLTMDRYRDAKARLLSLIRAGGGIVVNAGDPAWASLSLTTERLLVVRIEGEESAGIPSGIDGRLPDLVAERVSISGEGSRFAVRWGDEEAAVSLPLLGRFNVENALAALGAVLLLGMGLEEGVTGLSMAPSALGRLEVTVREPVPVILDYAHTPHALERLLEAVRPLYPGRILLVFGAGGDRDREKRPVMGRVAAQGADLAIVTSDNPRTEDPDAIIDDILPGMSGVAFERITDRREAIGRALSLARPGDVVVLAGKGHEKYQVIGSERLPFDERQVVRELLESGRAA